jgi:hypothetical protein
VGFVHYCFFCGWRRDSSSPTILTPHCERCGCLLSSSRQDEAPASPGVLEVGRARPRPGVAHALKLAALGSLMFAATVWGFNAGGPWVALGAFAASGLLAVPAAFDA